MKKRLIGAGIVTAAASAGAVASHALTKYMMALALNREQPNQIIPHKALSGTSGKEDFLKAAGEAAERLKSRETEEVEITGRDGIRLVGHLRLCEKPERMVVAMHGWRSSWYSDFGMMADFWNENHCIVLFAEQRGQNNSGGDYIGFGMLERFDCLDWANWMNHRFPEHYPMYLAGVSMGASTVLMAAGLDLPDNVKGIAADCGFTSPYAIWKHVMNDNLHLSYGLHSAAVEDLCRKKIQMGPEECSTTEALKHCKIPVMLVHGTDDSFVPVTMTYENYKACAGPKKLLVVPGADHGMSYFIEKEKYEAEALEFWKECEARS